MRKKILLITMILFLAGTAFADRASEIQDLKLEKEKLNSEIQKLNRQIAATDSMLKADDSRYKTLQQRYKADSTPSSSRAFRPGRYTFVSSAFVPSIRCFSPRASEMRFISAKSLRLQ